MEQDTGALLQNNTQLRDRTLWFDGDITIASDQLLSYLNEGNSLDGVYIDKITPEIKQYNKFKTKENQLSVKTTVGPLDKEWVIPDDFKSLNIEEYVFSKLESVIGDLSQKEAEERYYRVAYELACYKKLGFYDVLRTIIFIINRLENKQVVWGVGRGSSVSSYVLYVIGVHDIDSVKYQLNIHDFLRFE